MSDSNIEIKEPVPHSSPSISEDTKPGDLVSVSQSSVTTESTDPPSLEKETVDKLISIRQNLSLTKVKASKSLLDILNLCSSLVSIVFMQIVLRIKISFGVTGRLAPKSKGTSSLEAKCGIGRSHRHARSPRATFEYDTGRSRGLRWTYQVSSRCERLYHFECCNVISCPSR